MRVVPFTPDDSERWDELVAQAPMATFLHTRRFLSYHGDRLQDASVLLTDEHGALRGLLPAALDPADAQRVVSHPGATYGGLVHDGGVYAEEVRDALRAVFAHYAERGLRALRYKPVPHIYHRTPSSDDVWALSALGATRVGSALSCAIDLAARRTPTQRRVRSLKKALRGGIEVSEDPVLTGAFWPVLESTLERRHSARPVHSLEEIELLRGRFPDAIRLVAGLLDGEVVAGIVLFRTPRVVHVQYMASSERGMRVSALDAVAERCIELAEDEGARYFDFGTSMEDRGDELQPGLHRFKAEFGGGGVIHESYEQVLVKGPGDA
jgi:CelD/BcsL family acetyltransferase involved in cellulose biosynthesis